LRGDAIARRTEIERVLRQDRRRLEGEPLFLAGRRKITGAIGPGDFQVLHIPGRDLSVGGVALSGLGVAPDRPAIDRATFGVGALVVTAAGQGAQSHKAERREPVSAISAFRHFALS